MPALLLNALHQLSYAGLFGLLVGAAIVLPIPEEVTLLSTGYFIAIGFLSFAAALPVAIAGLLLGDCVLFGLARAGSSRVGKFRDRINHLGLERTWIFSPKQPLRAVVILRFLTGFRFIAPIYAGFEQVSWKMYLLTDAIVLFLFVPGMLFLGWYFHAAIIPFIAGFEVVRHGLFIGILALAGAGFLPVLYRRIRKLFKNSRS